MSPSCCKVRVDDPSIDGWRLVRYPCLAGRWIRGENHRLARLLRKVEVLREVAEPARVLAHVGSRIGPPVRFGIDALASEEVILDELEISIEAQRLVVDVALLGVRADDDAGDAQSVAVRVNAGRCHVIVEAAPVIP